MDATGGVLVASPDDSALHCSVCAKDFSPPLHVPDSRKWRTPGIFKYEFSLGSSFSDKEPLPSSFRALRRSIRSHFTGAKHHTAASKKKLADEIETGKFGKRHIVATRMIRTGYTLLKRSLPYTLFEDLVVMQHSNGTKVGNINHSRSLMPVLRSEFCGLLREQLSSFIREQPCVAVCADKVTVANRTVDVTAILAVVPNAPPGELIQSFVVGSPVVKAHDGQSLAKELAETLGNFGVIHPDQISAICMDGQYHMNGVPAALIKTMATSSGVHHEPRVPALWDGSHLLNLADADARRLAKNQWVKTTVETMTRITKRQTGGKGLEDFLSEAARSGSSTVRPKLWSETRFAPYASRTFEGFLRNWSVTEHVLVSRARSGSGDAAVHTDLAWLSEKESKVRVSALVDTYKVLALGSTALQDTGLLPWERKEQHANMLLQLELKAECIEKLTAEGGTKLDREFDKLWPSLREIGSADELVASCPKELSDAKDFVQSLAKCCENRSRAEKGYRHQWQEVGAMNRVMSLNMPGLKKIGDLAGLLTSDADSTSSIEGQKEELVRAKLVPEPVAARCTIEAREAAKKCLLQLPDKADGKPYSNEELYSALWCQAQDNPVLQGYLDLVTRIWLIDPPESVVESMASVIDHIFGDHRQLKHTSAEEELQIHWNGPPPHQAGALIRAHQSAYPRSFCTSSLSILESTVMRRFAREKVHRPMFS